jgi:lipopolysaccharide transport system ATP-binding protein
MSTDEIVVRVNNVSKIYHLWGSSKDRLLFPLRRLFGFLKLSRTDKSGKRLEGYREFFALHGVSFEIRKGESWGFIGVNGSGKSTLLKIISGNLRPSAGTIEVDGKVAILDYGSGFNGEFTGRENIYLKGSLLGLDRKRIDQRFKSIEEFADIGEFIDQPVKTYSSGMSARLGFAIMAHVDADILITDEALAVGDAFFVQKCMRHIRTFLKRGTFLFVSHSTNDVMSLCDHAIWLEHGRAVRVGKARDVCAAYLSSVDGKNSAAFLAESQPAAEVAPETQQEQSANQFSELRAAVQTGRGPKEIQVSADVLATLKHHYAPATQRERASHLRISQIDICEPIPKDSDGLAEDGAVGGGKIFSVTITDDQNRAVTAVLGGESVCLTVRAIAEKTILRPIIGFQLKNSLGLSLVAENTYLATKEQDIGLRAGEIITARFAFFMPLVGRGEYVIRAALADGVEDNNALIDVKHEALLLRCETSGARHGLVGVPMISIEVSRDLVPSIAKTRSDA